MWFVRLTYSIVLHVAYLFELSQLQFLSSDECFALVWLIINLSLDEVTKLSECSLILNIVISQNMSDFDNFVLISAT